MISTNLTGNLGNHMWQYAVCRTIAEKLTYEWGIDSSPTHDYHNGMNQMYFMDVDFGKHINNINYEYHEPWRVFDNVNINMFDSNIYNIKDNTILIGKNGAKGGIFQSEDYILERKKDIQEWFKIKEEYNNLYQSKLNELEIILDENLCVINFRGGEYRGLVNVILRKEYWRDSINHMISLNPNMKFLVITDDPDCANYYMPFPILTLHVDIGFDFYVVNQAKWLIISNSTFGWWAAWLNQKANKIIAPKYWSSHNLSNGYWGTGDSYTSCFIYMDREGNLCDFESCKNEAVQYYKSKNLI